MSQLENTILSTAKQMLVELHHFIDTPSASTEDQQLAEEHGITVEELHNNCIANKMIEVKTLTQLAFTADSGFSDQAIGILQAIDDECTQLLKDHSWVTH